jgi:AAHS family 4-hydroxybenzoate transporter-like MFS transporter
VISVSELVDGQRISPFLIGVIALGFVTQLGDGYDLTAAAYAAPGVIRAWHVKREFLAPVFSASLFGMLIGAPAFGHVGDRYGRRIALIVAAVVCGLFTLGASRAGSLPTLMGFRFLTGIGLGGLATNIVALMAEYAPARARATLITVMFMGITFGGMTPGMVTVLAPKADWRILMLVGAVIPLAAAVLNALFLPESLKFLAARRTAQARVLALARTMRPDLTLPDDTEFHFPPAPTRVRLRDLFEQKLKWITPLVWVLFITNLLVNFFISSWMPTVLRETGLSAGQAALTTSMYYVGGVVGGLTISRFLDRSGLGVVGVFMIAACPAVALLGLPGYSALELKLVVFLVGVTVLGNQLGLNAVAGLCYPTAIRANGVGWALGVGRVGAIIGPLAAGQLLAMRLPLQYLFLAPIPPLAIGAVAAFFLRPLAHDRFGGGRRQANTPDAHAVQPLSSGVNRLA